MLGDLDADDLPIGIFVLKGLKDQLVSTSNVAKYLLVLASHMWE